MTTELLVIQNISSEMSVAFSGAVMFTELEVSIEKRRQSVFEKTTIIFNLFVREEGKLYLNTNGAFHTV